MLKSHSINNILHPIDSETFLNKSERNIQRVNNKLDDYLRDPNEEQIHDIRTAVRRLRASNQALPKAIRNKKKLKEFVAKSKKLFTLNSEIRDFDIILELLSKYTQDVSSPKRDQHQVSYSSQAIASISKSLETLRNRKLTASKALAVDLRKLAVPSLDNDKINKSQKKLRKRFNRIVVKFANTIERNYPVVLSSPKRLAELHEMRKDCKKLRYLLELMPDITNSKDDGKDNVSQLIEELEKVQDMLGTIHDYDTTIAYTKKYMENHPKNHSSLKNIVKYLYEDRQKKFEQFTEYCKADLSNSRNNLFLNIMNIT
ncbi:MAG TPA: CHAD domain-containing protein [Nitrososphaeraceae archaeon]|jgi:CHAD domain-containing protein